MKIKDFNITIMVSDMDRSIAFYTEKLGFQQKSRFENHWAEVEGYGLTIGIHPKNAETKYGDNLQIGLGVLNMDESVKELQQKGIELEAREDGPIQLAPFIDPDGNQLYLVWTPY